MMIDEGRILIVDKGKHKIGGPTWWSGRDAGFRVDCYACMSYGSQVSDAAYFGAACDNVHNSFGCRLYRFFIAASLALGECVLALVGEQVL